MKPQAVVLKQFAVFSSSLFISSSSSLMVFLRTVLKGGVVANSGASRAIAFGISLMYARTSTEPST